MSLIQKADSLRTLSGNLSLRWVQEDARTFSLRDPEQTVFSMLQFEKYTGSLATGKTSDGQWTFKRVGFFRPCISVRPVGQDATVAIFRRARLHFAGGRVLVWNPARSRSERGFEDLEGRKLVRLQPDFGSRKYGATVEISAARNRSVEVSIAVLMSWYIALLLQRQREVDRLTACETMMRFMGG